MERKPETLLTAEKLENLWRGSKSDAWKGYKRSIAVLNSIAKLPYEYARTHFIYFLHNSKSSGKRRGNQNKQS